MPAYEDTYSSEAEVALGSVRARVPAAKRDRSAMASEAAGLCKRWRILDAGLLLLLLLLQPLRQLLLLLVLLTSLTISLQRSVI